MNKQELIDKLNHLANLAYDVDNLQQELAVVLGDSATWDSYEVFHQLDDLIMAADRAVKQLEQEVQDA